MTARIKNRSCSLSATPRQAGDRRLRRGASGTARRAPDPAERRGCGNTGRAVIGPVHYPDAAAPSRTVDLVGQPQCRVIIADRGARNARENLLTVARRLNAPVLTTFKAKAARVPSALLDRGKRAASCSCSRFPSRSALQPNAHRERSPQPAISALNEQRIAELRLPAWAS